MFLKKFDSLKITPNFGFYLPYHVKTIVPNFGDIKSRNNNRVKNWDF